MYKNGKINGCDIVGLITNEHQQYVSGSIDYFRQNIWTKENVNIGEYEPKKGTVLILGWKNTGLIKMIREIVTKKD